MQLPHTEMGSVGSNARLQTGVFLLHQGLDQSRHCCCSCCSQGCHVEVLLGTLWKENRLGWGVLLTSCQPAHQASGSLKWWSIQGRCLTSIKTSARTQGPISVSQPASCWRWGFPISCLLWCLVCWRLSWWQSQLWDPSWGMIETSVLFPTEQSQEFGACVLKRSHFPEQFLRDSSGLSWGECNVTAANFTG